MPLIPPAALLPPEELGPVHFIAIGGAGMSGVAALFADRGVSVSGSDQADSETLRGLAEHGITTYVGHDVDHLGTAETVVVSSAIRESNPELAEARRRGLRVWHRSTALASLMSGRRGVAVGGTHGKTTTTAMIATTLDGAGVEPSYVIGAPLASSGVSAHAGDGEAFVVEADESDGSFLQYPAEIVVVTNVEADHLDNWETPEAYAAGYRRFVSGQDVRAAVINLDDPGARDLVDDVRSTSREVEIVTYGEVADADVRISDIALAGTSGQAVLSWRRDQGVEVQVGAPGRHNLSNAAAAWAVARLLGVDGERAAQALAAFGGTQRRFQRVGASHGIEVFDDYAHHPTEVAATLTAARTAAGERRVVACFQPHLFSRTRDFAAEFGEALALADEIVVLDIYPAREDPIPGVTGRLIVDAADTAAGSALSSGRVHWCPELAEAPEFLAELVRPGDLVLTIGAGNVTTVGPALVRLLDDRLLDDRLLDDRPLDDRPDEPGAAERQPPEGDR